MYCDCDALQCSVVQWCNTIKLLFGDGLKLAPTVWLPQARKMGETPRFGLHIDRKTAAFAPKFGRLPFEIFRIDSIYGQATTKNPWDDVAILM